MARYKKKKSAPVEPAGEPAGGPEDVPADAPEGQPQAPPSVEPPAPPAPPPVEAGEKERKLNLLFWMRVVLAVVAGAAATFIFDGIEGEERRWASIGFMIIVFAATIPVAKSMRMQLPSSDRKKIVTQAIGSYVFLYLFTWIVTYTLANSGGGAGGINA
ncbi:MAG: hypothetical protein MPJ06_00970 [Nitrosopumilus sp.]|nr:hypothetical protein [Nitrosopumilus sp.]MDA7942569.1 hypothetical protein [Nitrosopumilus sp.]MDA7959427.1 hypothetical protein [Nitrosopumilus sp.]